MEKMTKKEKFKKFVNDHEELIVATTYLAAAAALIISVAVIINKSAKDLEDEETDAKDEFRAWVEWMSSVAIEKDSEGKDTYLLHNSDIVAIPKDTPVERIQRKR